MVRDAFYYGALPAPRLTLGVPVAAERPAEPCPLCYRDAGIPFPLGESRTVCPDHKQGLLDAAAQASADEE